MLGPWVRTTAVLMLLLPQAARPLDLGDKSQHDANQLSAFGDNLYRQSRFEEAQSAYSHALDLDPHNVPGHLGLGKIAELLSDRGAAAKHFSAAYQVEPFNPEVILAFADVVGERGARQTLLRNFLALSPAKDRKSEDVQARLHIEEQLGTRNVAELKSVYESYLLPLSNLRSTGSRREGLLLHVRINGSRELKLILDTGATGVMLNASAIRNSGLEFLAPAALTGYGSAAPSPARVALAASFETGALRIANLLAEVSEIELTPDADGVIGLDVFQDFLIRVDPRARVLELNPLDESSCKDCMQAYRLGHLLLVRAEVDGHGEGCFILDSGSPYTLISQRLMTRSGHTTQMTGAQGDQAVVLPSSPVALRLGDKHLWGFEYATLDTGELSASNGTAIAGAIGYSLLRDLSLTVNYRSGLVKFGTPGK